MASLDPILSNIARGDGLHDFGPTQGPTEARGPVFNEGMKVASTVASGDEDAILNIVFGTPGIPAIKIRDKWKVMKDGETQTFPVLSGGEPFAVKKVELGTPLGLKRGGAELVDLLGIAGSALVVDFSHHGFLARLKKGPAAPDRTVYYIFSSEIVNDPAPKCPPEDPIFKPGGGGVNMVACVQQGTSPYVYPGNTSFDPKFPQQDFISKYTLTLSPIHEVRSMGKLKSRIVNMVISHPDGKMIAEVKDSKKHNSPESMKGFLQSLFGKPASPTTSFGINTKWVQKRSGDWLQVLCARDMNNRTFVPALPAKTKPIFVTHDRIAVAYALMMGVSTLYFSEDDILLFSNTPPEDPVAYCTEKLAARPPAEITAVTAFRTKLAATRTTALAEWNNAIMKNATLLAEAKALTDIEKLLVQILRAAMHYSHVYTGLPETTELEASLASPDPCKKFRAYSTVKTLYDIHRNDANIATSYNQQFEKTDVFKSVMNWKLEPAANILTRIFKHGDQSDARDTFIFLPYIAAMQDTGVKTVLANAFRGLQRRANQPGQLESWGARTESRQKRVKLGLDNLLEQAYVFLKSDGSGNVKEDGDVFRAATSAPDAPADEGKPGFANRLRAGLVALTNRHRPSVPDTVEESEKRTRTSDAEERSTRTRRGGRRRTFRGGWPMDGRITFLNEEIDSRQVSYPLLAAFMYYTNSAALEAEEIPDEVMTVGGAETMLAPAEVVTATPEPTGTVSLKVIEKSPEFLGLVAAFSIVDALLQNIYLGLENHPDIQIYAQYANFLTALLSQFGKTTTGVADISRALYALLFTANNTAKGRALLEKAMGIASEEYMPIALISAGLSDMFGRLIDEEEGLAETELLLAKSEVSSFLQSAWRAARTATEQEGAVSPDAIKNKVELLRITLERSLGVPEEAPIVPPVEEARATQVAALARRGLAGGKTRRRKVKPSKSSRRTRRLRHPDPSK